MQIINDIYGNNDNFLVKKPEQSQISISIPLNTNPFIFTPFLKTEQSEIRKYIESSYYWADNSTIEIIIKELKINVVVLEYDKKQQIMKIPFPNLKNMEDFNKYVFFYYENNHYELITFSFMSPSGNTLKKAIFDNDNTVIIPPIYIIFLLFAVYYIQMNETDQQEITLFSSFFNIFQESFQKIYNSVAEKEKKKTNFMKKFHTYLL